MSKLINGYNIEQLFWDKEYEFEIQEVYRMLKDQENKIFDLTWYEANGNIMDFVEEAIKKGSIFIAIYNNDICGFILLDNPITFGDVITRADIHAAVRRRYWGKQSRDIMNAFKQYLHDNFYIKKLIASVPQCGYGVIKLLKDIGFVHEGTLKEARIFKDKDDKPKYYDELIYSLNNKEL